MTRWFGTDGIRGRANTEPLQPEFIIRLGLALGEHWNDRGSDAVVVGHDGRVSGDMVRESLGAGLMSRGYDVIDLGLVTTPALSFLTRENDVAGGVMISASHNEFSDNGIKCFQHNGEKLTENQEENIEELIQSGSIDRAHDDEIGTNIEPDIGIDSYVEAVRSDVSYSGHVVVDCANGGASRLATAVLEGLAEELTVINDEPNGININKESGSLHLDSLIDRVGDLDADLGFAFDGDGDRLKAVDSTGRIVDGDVLMNLLATGIMTPSDDGNNGIVITVMSNLGLRKVLDRDNIPFEVVGVGDRNVYRAMKDRGWRFGGEQSGHIIDRNWLPTGDGMRTVVSVLRVLSEQGERLDSWNQRVEEYPQVLHNVEVSEKPPIETLRETNKRVEETEEKLGNEGRVLVRYSGTEPVARIMLEGPREDELHDYADAIGDTMTREIENKQGEKT